MRVKITEIDEVSQYFGKKEIIGLTLEVDGEIKPCSFTSQGFYRANFKNSDVDCIYGFKYIEVPEIRGHMHNVEPSVMSELGRFDTFADWLNARFNHGCVGLLPQPKKKSWLQKIRGYDDLERQRNQFRSKSDMMIKETMQLKSALSEALCDRDFNARTADIWQGRLVNQNALLGKRLKFSVSHNHITIIVGNPVTYIDNIEHVEDGFNIFKCVSICSKKDVYDWKKGVIQSLENLCNEAKFSKELRRDLRKALAKKYPEVFEVTK